MFYTVRATFWCLNSDDNYVPREYVQVIPGVERVDLRRVWRVERQATAALHNARADPAVGRTIQHDGSFCCVRYTVNKIWVNTSQ